MKFIKRVNDKIAKECTGRKTVTTLFWRLPLKIKRKISHHAAYDIKRLEKHLCLMQISVEYIVSIISGKLFSGYGE